MTWSIEASADAPLPPDAIFAYYLRPETWSVWGHNTKWARARGEVEKGAIVDVKAGYGKVYPVLVTALEPDRFIECEVRPPGMLVMNRYWVAPNGEGSRVRHGIEVSGRFAGIAKAIGFDRLYTRLLRREVASLIRYAVEHRAADATGRADESVES